MHIDFNKLGPENWLYGMRWREVSHHKGMQVIWACTLMGLSLGSWYFVRLCTKAPDVTWRHTSNPQPWEKMPQSVQYRFWSPTIDYKKRGLYPDSERPDIDLRPATN
ncbi:NADH dehydrogenase [ubiquinone] 1 alpha subcomplex subunit 4-like 2 [Ostrea edulis]|uniref:NADH dehydrogenase [ubiquinone] 1 alpha subcomplex subunit 4-like 2 n=1 Tax=Ostrea edulis TaxID=37623 RepID=UPI0020942FC4|nr:NADH dehydrogenase [ubiquinone] 1 alpha subcomplex subunit 4-like 2 [Ostrea edulis]